MILALILDEYHNSLWAFIKDVEEICSPRPLVTTLFIKACQFYYFALKVK